MLQKWYRAHILKRFMTPSEQERFDGLYKESKIRALGQKEARKKIDAIKIR